MSSLKKSLVRSTLVLLCCVMLSACALPGSSQQLNQAMVQTAVADSLVGTQAAGTLTAMAPPATSTLLPPTTVPDTPTPTRTPLLNVTSTLAGVWLTLPVDVDCLSGPGEQYQSLVIIRAGRLVEIMALEPQEDYYFIRDPDNFSQFCWIPVISTSVSGNMAYLPVITPQNEIPLPAQTSTPGALDFNVRYQEVISCKGKYGIVLYVENTGSVILRSIYVILTDTSVNRSTFHFSNLFRGVKDDECVINLDNAQQDLQIGEGSLIACVNSGQFDFDPTGHSFTARITMYNKDDRGGQYVTKTITFVP